MLGEVIDSYKKGNIQVNVIDSYVHPNYEINISGKTGEQGCLHEEMTAEELYNKYINKEPY